MANFTNILQAYLTDTGTIFPSAGETTLISKCKLITQIWQELIYPQLKQNNLHIFFYFFFLGGGGGVGGGGGGGVVVNKAIVVPNFCVSNVLKEKKKISILVFDIVDNFEQS